MGKSLLIFCVLSKKDCVKRRLYQLLRIEAKILIDFLHISGSLEEAGEKVCPLRLFYH